jgi:hypothetical protein
MPTRIVDIGVGVTVEVFGVGVAMEVRSINTRSDFNLTVRLPISTIRVIVPNLLVMARDVMVRLLL